jgi:tight adherence protein C
MNAAASGALLGLTAAAGLLLIIARIRAQATPSLVERIAPYVTGPVAAAVQPRRADSGVAALIAVLQPTFLGSAQRDDLVARLARAGRSGDLQRFRLERVVASAVGLLVGVVLGVLVIGNGAPLSGAVVLGVVGAITGPLLMDRRLRHQGRQRSQRISQQLPNVAELLAFSVAAGESPTAALERIGDTVDGELADEIRTCVADLRDGQPIHDALRGLADRCGVAEVERFVDGLVISLERGTPLVDVLRAQAADCRAAQRRHLMELAGRKDVLMLIPVVFFILPTVVLIALFPGAVSLDFLVP